MSMHRQRNISGFTIVELLIVIVVIAILAAISVVAFRGIQERARASQATSALAQAKKKLELYKIDNGAYPASGDLASAGITDTDTSYQYTSSGATFCLTATAGTTSYKISNVGNPEQGGCAGHGQGGVAAITNIAPNPGAEGLNGWSSNNGAQYPASRNTTIKRSGAQSVESHHLSDHTLLMSLYAVGATSTAGFAVQPNTQYNISFYFRSGVPHQARVYCAFRLGDGSYTTTAYGNYTQGAINEWTRTGHVCASPADANMLRMGVHIYALTTQPAGTSAYVDDLMVTEGPNTYNFADGSTTDWIWNGAPNASTSTGPAS